MLSGWGLSTADYVLYALVSGIWNVFALLGLPAVALLVLTTARHPKPRSSRRRGGPGPAPASA